MFQYVSIPPVSGATSLGMAVSHLGRVTLCVPRPSNPGVVFRGAGEDRPKICGKNMGLSISAALLTPGESVYVNE